MFQRQEPIGMTKLYRDVLDEPRLKVFRKLRIFAHYGGVLAGGTALAFQLRHRRSEDFDIFFPKLITSELRYALVAISKKPINVRLDNSRQLTLSDGQGVKVTLATHEFPPIYPVVKTESLPLFHLADIASNKAFTIGKRGIWRDYVDLFFLLTVGDVTLEQIIKESEERFGDQFSAKLFLEQLAYTKDIVDFQIDYIDRAYTPEETISYLEKTVKEYLKKPI